MLITRFLLSAGIAVVCALPAAVSAASVATPDTWVPAKGDMFIVDRQANTGYLLHAHSTEYLPFLIATGMKKQVSYLGMNYYAQTPLRTWVARQSVTQSNRVDFGVTGRFLRLYINGETRTSYGIHGYKYFDTWLQESDRYRSLGCIVMSERMLDIIEQTYVLNNNSLLVVTTEGPQAVLDALSAREQGGWSEA